MSELETKLIDRKEIDLPKKSLRIASRPASFSPRPGIELPQDVFGWLPRYTRPPVLAYVDMASWPVLIRTQATVRRDHIGIGSDVETSEGAPACLTYHRLVGDHRANDAFIIRGHFDERGNLIPEKVVGYGGTKDDRGERDRRAGASPDPHGRNNHAEMRGE